VRRRRGIVLTLVLILLGLGAIVVGAVVLANGASGEPAEPRDDGPAVGARAPRLAGTNAVTGGPVSLADYRGSVVVINVWASWCDDCAKEAEALRRFANRNPKVPVLGLDIEDTPADARAYYERWKLDHPSILDPEGAQAAKLGVSALPETVVLNRDHLIVRRITGPTSLGELEEAVAEAGRPA
jgi:thiol-disulfide isomerase/thioredoxin